MLHYFASSSGKPDPAIYHEAPIHNFPEEAPSREVAYVAHYGAIVTLTVGFGTTAVANPFSIVKGGDEVQDMPRESPLLYKFTKFFLRQFVVSMQNGSSPDWGTRT
jgi:hypothetical protein